MRFHLSSLFFGALFGFTLGWSRLAEPETIYRMLRLMEPDVFLLMGSAIAVATVGTRLLRKRGARAWFGGEPISWRTALPSRDHVVGSVIFGIGWSVACTCPGPAAVQIGRGDLSGVIITLGMMAGIAIRNATRATPAPVVQAAAVTRTAAAGR